MTVSAASTRWLRWRARVPCTPQRQLQESRARAESLAARLSESDRLAAEQKERHATEMTVSAGSARQLRVASAGERLALRALSTV
jgi:hypothetical protein